MTDVVEQNNLRHVNCNNCLALNHLSREQVETGKVFVCHHCGGKLPMKEFNQAFDMSNETWEDIRQERLVSKKDSNRPQSQPVTIVNEKSKNDSSCMGAGCGCLTILFIFYFIMASFGAFG